jgi:hypothetical protein
MADFVWRPSAMTRAKLEVTGVFCRGQSKGIKLISPVLVRQHLRRVFAENKFNPVRVE